MRLVIQRVQYAKVTVDGHIIGEIGKGLLILVGVSQTDSSEEVCKLVEKVGKLRIFEDEQGKTNLSIADVQGEALIISQFTLYADCKKGNRPSFTDAGSPDLAKKLYQEFIDEWRQKVTQAQAGEFGADMKVELLNDGPFTIMLDSENMGRK